MIKLLIVDDSLFNRNMFTKILSGDSEITVIGTASNGIEAIEQIKILKPNVVTLDIDMPKMDGLTALKHIMQECPVPVIMVSSLVADGSEATKKALELGAVDYVQKDMESLSGNIGKLRDILIAKIKAASKNIIFRKPKTNQDKSENMPCSSSAEKGIFIPFKPSKTVSKTLIKVIAIGASTGGPKAIRKIVAGIPHDFPIPILISLHMHQSFTAILANKLNNVTNLDVKEAKDGDELLPGTVYLAPGGRHMRLKQANNKVVIETFVDFKNFVFCPSVDVLMSSVAQCYKGNAIGVILTGMSKDGLKGFGELKNAGGIIIAQDEKSSEVYGMAKAVVQAGNADYVLPINNIADKIISIVCENANVKAK